jgi:hypothetical protein
MTQSSWHTCCHQIANERIFLAVFGGAVERKSNQTLSWDDGSCDEIYESISRLKPGDNLVITVFRQGQAVKLPIPIQQ